MSLFTQTADLENCLPKESGVAVFDSVEYGGNAS